MARGLNWSKTQREMRVQRMGGEFLDGTIFGNELKTTGARQASLEGPRRVARRGPRARAGYLGKVRKAIACGSEIPSPMTLPAKLVAEIENAGGPLVCAMSQPDTIKKTREYSAAPKEEIQTGLVGRKPFNAP